MGQVEEILRQAQRLPGSDLPRFLDEACGADAALRAQVDVELERLRTGGTIESSGAEPASLRPALEGLRPGEVVGDFRIEVVLGAGGFGTVYRATDARGRRVALKTVRVPRSGLVMSIRREIHALSRLRHPGIVPIVASGIQGGLPWYAMELLPYPTLGDHVRGRDGGIASTLTLVRRLCLPLAYLHGEGLVHRDLKPDNVVVSSAGDPVILDFGLASTIQADASREVLEVAGHTVGTIAYMAPEQARGELVDARSDLYAVGCILYELLTGSPPFVGTLTEVMTRLQTERPAPLASIVPGIGSELDALVMRLLAKEPRERPGFAEELAADLERLGARDGDPGAASRPRPYLYRPALSGREAWLRRAEQALRELKKGRGALLLVAGESGVGKTRMATEIGRRATQSGALVLTGSADASNRAPLAIFRGVLQGVADFCRERGAAAAAAVVGARAAALATYEPSLGELPGVPPPQPIPPAPPDEARARVVEAVIGALRALSATSSVVVLLDDLQWADELSLEILATFAGSGRLAGSRVLVVGTYRAEEAPPILLELSQQGAATLLVLDRLRESDVSAMVAGMLAMEPPPGGLVGLLASGSGGNPLFVSEYLRSAVDQGLLFRDAGAWHLRVGAGGDGASLAMPASVDRILLERLALVSAAGLRMLHAAAVLGEPLELPLLARVSGLDEAGVMEAASELLRRQILQDLGERLAFTHGRLHEAAYRALGEADRSGLHRAAAEALLAGPEPDRHAAALGRHWEVAGDPRAARAWYLRAARAESRRYAHEEAVRLFRAYLRLVTSPSEESIRARDEMAMRGLWELGRMAEATDELRTALAEARGIGADALSASLLFGLGQVIARQARHAEALELYAQALAECRRLGDGRMEGRLLGAMGNLRDEEGATLEAIALFEQALDVHRRAGDDGGESMTLPNLARLYRQVGRDAEAVDLDARSIAQLRARGDERRFAIAMANKGISLFNEGDLEAARGCLEEAVAAAARVHSASLEALVLEALGGVEAAAGRREAARAHYDRALEMQRALGEPASLARTASSLAVLLLDEGDVHRAAEMIAEAVALLGPRADPARLSEMKLRQGRILLVLGRVEEGVGALEQALEVARGTARLPFVTLALCGLGHGRLAQRRSAAELLEEARSLRARLPEGPRGLASDALASLAKAQAAFEQGEPLVAGYHGSSLRPGLLAWLRQHGSGPAHER